ncbi:MAG: hypothetical protein ACYTGQ_14720, partial [Planctomycetota bacterium]
FSGDPIRDRRKSAGRVSLLVENTRNVSVGQGCDTLADYQVDDSVDADTSIALHTGPITLNVPMRWEVSGRIFIRQEDPLPLSVLGVITDAGIGGRASV